MARTIFLHKRSAAYMGSLGRPQFLRAVRTAERPRAQTATAMNHYAHLTAVAPTARAARPRLDL